MAAKRFDLTGLDAMTAAGLVWGSMLVIVLLFLLVAGAWSRRQSRHQLRLAASATSVGPEAPRLTPAERARLRAEAGELVRQAAAAAVAAKRLQAAVLEAKARAHAAQQAREVAWLAFDAAQRAFNEARLDGSGVLELHVPDDGDADDPRRELTKAALAAYRRGDISVEQLGAVFRQATGWDPEQESRAREIEVRRAEESRARRMYQAAAAAERSAYQAADVAVIAARALAEESVEVAAEARAVREALSVSVVRGLGRTPVGQAL